MPDNPTGRATPSTNKGGARRSNVLGTPVTNNVSLPNSTNLAARLAATTGLVKNTNKAKLFLEQRSLIALENNFGMDTLANLLISTSFEARIPDQVIHVMRAVAFLMVGKFQNIFAEEMAIVVTEKLLSASESITKQLEREHEFLAASTASQAKNTQQLSDLAATIKNISQNLTSTSQILTTSTDNIAKSAADIQPVIQTLTSPTEHMSSIVELAKTLAKAVDDLKNNPLSLSQPQQSPQGTQPSYASIVGTNTQLASTSQAFDPEIPEYVTRIENRLRIQERQAFITFDNEAADSPKERNGSAAYALRSKINEWIRSMDQETNQVTSTSRQPIKALQFTERIAMLLEFNSKEHTDRFQTYCKDRELLTRICSTAKVQARTCRVVFKFVTCDGSFLPENKEHLRTLESEHNLEEGSIITASWIKKPERHAPNQKTANVKVFCASPVVANHLLRERIFVSNSRIVVIKDTQEPIRCNKCQEYGHICERCENTERCVNCARPHSTNECNYPNNPHCVSCGTSSKHASSDKGSCPQFAKHASSIDARLPENAMPYFPVLGQPNTFILAAKNTHVPTVNYSNRPRPNPNSSNHQPQ